MKQIGNYVIEHRPADERPWWVRMAGSEEDISWHYTERAARLAVERYQMADKRRSA